MIISRLKEYALLMRLHRPIGSLLLLWPTLWALWIASNGHPNPFIVVIFIAGVVIMRSAGDVINDIADRNIDPRVTRTRTRPLAAKRVSLNEAIALFIFLCFIALLLVLQLNHFAVLLSFVGLGLAIIYPFTKRYTYWPQLILGAAYGWAVPMAFAAQSNHLPMICWLIYLATVLWAVAYDTPYAMVDKADDLVIGVKSTAILFGQYDKWIIAGFQFAVLVLLWIVGTSTKLNHFYFASLGLAAGFFIYQQHLIKHRVPAQCFKAFLNNNWVGLVVFGGIVLGYSAL